MNRDEADLKLVASLEQVREYFDAGDNWKIALLRTFREYSKAIGIEHRLIDPLQAWVMEIGSNNGDVGMPNSRSIPLAFAAACVTILKNRGDCATIDDAVKDVAKAAGYEKTELKSFRANMSRPKLTRKKVRDAYCGFIAQLRDWPKAEMIAALKEHGALFVK